MLRNLVGAMAVSAIIGGCATKPAEAPDNTPLHPTAVIERKIVNNGIKGFFPFESTERHYVRTNMRRNETTLKGTGTYSGFLVGTRSGTEITRIDRNLRWWLNTEKEEYTECPLKEGCRQPSKQPSAKKNQAAEKRPEAKHESGCTMRITNTSFTVKATGQKKSINGFDTDEYHVAWVVNLRDNAARKTISTLDMSIWTTPMTAAIRETLGMEESYSRALSQAVTSTGKQQIVPADAARLISAYLASSLKPGELNAFLNAGKQMEKIKGYPVSTRLTWNMEGNACAPKEAKDTEKKPSSKPVPTSAGGLFSSLAGMVVEKKTEEGAKESAREPILSLTSEVKMLKVEPLHDSIFTVPKNYRLASQP